MLSAEAHHSHHQATLGQPGGMEPQVAERRGGMGQ